MLHKHRFVCSLCSYIDILADALQTSGKSKDNNRDLHSMSFESYRFLPCVGCYLTEAANLAMFQRTARPNGQYLSKKQQPQSLLFCFVSNPIYFLALNLQYLQIKGFFFFFHVELWSQCGRSCQTSRPCIASSFFCMLPARNRN